MINQPLVMTSFILQNPTSPGHIPTASPEDEEGSEVSEPHGALTGGGRVMQRRTSEAEILEHIFGGFRGKPLYVFTVVKI